MIIFAVIWFQSVCSGEYSWGLFWECKKIQVNINLEWEEHAIVNGFHDLFPEELFFTGNERYALCIHLEIQFMLKHKCSSAIGSKWLGNFSWWYFSLHICLLMFSTYIDAFLLILVNRMVRLIDPRLYVGVTGESIISFPFIQNYYMYLNFMTCLPVSCFDLLLLFVFKWISVNIHVPGMLEVIEVAPLWFHLLWLPCSIPLLCPNHTGLSISSIKIPGTLLPCNTCPSCPPLTERASPRYPHS